MKKLKFLIALTLIVYLVMVGVGSFFGGQALVTLQTLTETYTETKTSPKTKEFTSIIENRTVTKTSTAVPPVVPPPSPPTRPIAPIVEIFEILRNPEYWKGKIVTIEGEFCRGGPPENLPGPPFHGPPVTRSDWIIADETGWIYVARVPPEDVNRSTRGFQVTVTGIVKILVKNGDPTPYIEGLNIREW